MPLFPSTTIYPSATSFPVSGAIIPPPAIVSSSRYLDIGVTRAYFLPTVASALLVPTRAEMNAGTSLTGELADWSGWVLSSEMLDVQNMGNRFKSTIPGSLSSPSCTMTFYSSKNGLDVRSVLPQGTTGFIEILDGGDILSNRAEVWPVTVATLSMIRGVIGGSSTGSTTDAAAQVLVSFAVTAAPAQYVSVPA